MLQWCPQVREETAINIDYDDTPDCFNGARKCGKRLRKIDGRNYEILLQWCPQVREETPASTALSYQGLRGPFARTYPNTTAQGRPADCPT